MPTIKILLVESDEAQLKNILCNLSEYGFDVVAVQTAAEMDQKLLLGTFDILVLNKDIEDENGLMVTRRVRAAHQNLGIVLLSESDELSNKILGLQLGADNFLVTPVNYLDLISVIESLARRLKLLIPDNDPFCVLDRQKLELKFVDDKEVSVKLTQLESKLLSCFAVSGSGMVTKEKLITSIDENPEIYDLRRLETAISRLRKKVCSECEMPDCIKSVRNKGYQFLSKIRIIS